MKQSYCWSVFLVDRLAVEREFDWAGLRRAGMAKRIQREKGTRNARGEIRETAES